MILASNLKEIMTQKGTNASQLAKAAKVNPTGVYDILSGKSRSPRLETINKIAQALGVPPASLFQERSSDALKQEILDVFDRLPGDERRRLLLTAEAWADVQSPNEQAS